MIIDRKLLSSDLNAGRRRAIDLSFRCDPLRERLRSCGRAARRDAMYNAKILLGIQDLRYPTTRMQRDDTLIYLRFTRYMRESIIYLQSIIHMRLLHFHIH